jgi:uncharacterized membrane protein
MRTLASGVTASPAHALLLAGTLPLFGGTLLADLAYGATYQVQWLNFAAWLVAGGEVFAGFAILFLAIDLLRGRGARPWLYAGLLVATFVLGFVDALQHAKDGWAAMPGATILSVFVLALALVCIWLAFFRAGARA